MRQMHPTSNKYILISIEMPPKKQSKKTKRPQYRTGCFKILCKLTFQLNDVSSVKISSRNFCDSYSFTGGMQTSCSIPPFVISLGFCAFLLRGIIISTGRLSAPTLVMFGVFSATAALFS